MMTRPEQVAAAGESLMHFASLVENEKPLVRNLQFKLQGLREIGGTLSSLEEGSVLDDIEFFEIKHLALLGDDVRMLLERCMVLDWAEVDFSRIIDILDPDGLRIGTFYIYDSYSMSLRELRRDLEGDPDNDELKDALANEEEAVRQSLVEKLQPYAGDLKMVMHSLAELDIMLAKAQQMKQCGYVVPKIGVCAEMKGMFNPEVKAALLKGGRQFQSVDFSFDSGVPATVIGANMGGKTVALKTLCLCQYLFQFGFAVPAASAKMMLFDSVQFCIGDDQDQRKGLSSFAAEMLRIDSMIKAVESGCKVLALVDEPARTTNPVEGSALVSALLKLLSGKDNLALVLTTHYKVQGAGQCWRVKGLCEGSKGMKMDYELVRSASNEVPHEALNIARELGINAKWLEEAAKEIETQ
jgi:Mismatch repair ATPase (MutS family)